MANYAIGNLIRLSVTITVNDVATDPTTLTFKIKSPSGTTTTYVYGTDVQLVKDSAGNYHVDVSPSVAGFHYYRWASTGTAQAAKESHLSIEATAF